MTIPTAVNASVQAHYTRSDQGSAILAALSNHEYGFRLPRGSASLRPPMHRWSG